MKEKQKLKRLLFFFAIVSMFINGSKDSKTSGLKDQVKISYLGPKLGKRDQLID